MKAPAYCQQTNGTSTSPQASCPSSKPLLCSTRNTCVPVSYTHLDVYKRQVLHGIAGKDLVLSGNINRIFLRNIFLGSRLQMKLLRTKRRCRQHTELSLIHSLNLRTFSSGDTHSPFTSLHKFRQSARYILV